MRTTSLGLGACFLPESCDLSVAILTARISSSKPRKPYRAGKGLHKVILVTFSRLCCSWRLLVVPSRKAGKLFLGGRFGPPKKIFSPPLPNSPQTPSRGPSPSWNPLSWDSQSRPSSRLELPLHPLPEHKKKNPKHPPRFGLWWSGRERPKSD